MVCPLRRVAGAGGLGMPRNVLPSMDQRQFIPGLRGLRRRPPDARLTGRNRLSYRLRAIALQREAF
jgi:hypothetical protein